MKALFVILIAAGFLVSLPGCSDDPPQFRVRNDRPSKANVQVKTSGGNTININDVQPGTVTAYQTAAEGVIEATATIQNETVSPSISFQAGNDGSYTIIVANTTPPTLVVVSP